MHSLLTQLPVIVRFAARDLRGGLRGLRIFLACIAIGVTAIVGVGAISDSLLSSVAGQGRIMLGGDMAFGRSQRALSPDERAFLARYGAVSEVATLRAMASAGSDRITTVELKAVDAAYPLVGALETEPPVSSPFAMESGRFGALADASLIERLGLKRGDAFAIGKGQFVLRGEIRAEPDKISTGLSFGPRVLLSIEGLDATGLRTETALIRWIARVASRSGMTETELGRAGAAIQSRFPDSGWEARTRGAVSPQLTRNVERFSQFMALIGVISLIVGGVGVAGAVNAFVDRKRASIAILKAVGASGGLVFRIVLAEMIALALVGALVGALLGAAAPYALAAFAGPALDLPFEPVLSPQSVATGVGVGLLTALAFIIAPAGRAHETPVATLFRLAVATEEVRLRRGYAVAAALALLLLTGLVYALTTEKKIAALAIAGVFLSAIILRGVARLIVALAARAPRLRRLPVRLALANIVRPGAVTTPVVVSLGLGLTLLVAIVGVDGNIRRQLQAGEVGRTPDYFFLDVQSSQAADFRRLLIAKRPDDAVVQAPMLRGRIVRIAGRSAAEIKAEENAAWVLEGDRGITYAAQPPAGSEVVEGRWWPTDYRGKPLVSMDAEIARGLGMKIGDEIAVNVAGRTIVAELANLRRVDWRSFGINFVLVFSPSTFAGAPHSELFTLTSSTRAAARDAALVREVASAFPNVTTLSVRDALEQALSLVEKLSTAVRAASSVTLVTALLVLAGALAAGQRARLYDAVVLRTLGATRARLVSAYLIEFLLLGAATSLFAVAAGSAIAWAVVRYLMKLGFVWNWPTMFAVVLIGCALTICLGLVATWRVLGEKPARTLREL